MAPSRVRIPPSPLAQRPPRFCAHPRRGGRAVECAGLANRYPSLGGSRVQIPPPPLGRSRPASVEVASTAYRGTVRLGAPRVLGYARRFLRTSCLFLRTYWMTRGGRSLGRPA